MSDKKPKKSSVRHTRAIQRDRTKRPNTAAPDVIIEQRLEDIVHPATLNQVAHFHALGLRERTLNLPVMMAFVLSLIWRQLGSVTEAVRTLNREGLLWVDERQVSQQAIEQRFSSLPASLFQRVLDEILPLMAARWQARTRPLPPALQWAQDHFTATVAVDGSTLDALLHKTGLLRDDQGGVLAGRMAGLLDVITRLPRQVWYEEDAQAHDQRFWDRILAGLERGMLVIFDLGFLNFARFDQLTDAGVWFLTRKETRTVTRTERVLRRPALASAASTKASRSWRSGRRCEESSSSTTSCGLMSAPSQSTKSTDLAETQLKCAHHMRLRSGARITSKPFSRTCGKMCQPGGAASWSTAKKSRSAWVSRECLRV
nr:hypothetical protein [Oscillochloris sp. ZM17-4]